MLHLTFVDTADYDKLQTGDRIDITGYDNLTPGVPVTMVVKKTDGNTHSFLLNHIFNSEQIVWFKAGSALNAMKEANA